MIKSSLRDVVEDIGRSKASIAVPAVNWIDNKKKRLKVQKSNCNKYLISYLQMRQDQTLQQKLDQEWEW